jgi:hypothetical protein
MTLLRRLTPGLSSVLAAAVLVVGCSADAPVGPHDAQDAHGAYAGLDAPAGAQAGGYGPEVQRWLAGLRAATARFHDFNAALAAGYEVPPITPCMEQPGVGGMGFHYADPNLIDDTVEEYAPEALLYEPQRNGRLRLVGVEYLVPFTEWPHATPPVLHGVPFHANLTFQVWALHVWAWEHNPAGIFQDWNPRITCKYAS